MQNRRVLSRKRGNGNSAIESTSNAVCPLLDYVSKSDAFRILCNSISSVAEEAIHHCVFSVGGRNGHQTWGLLAKSRTKSVLISTIVFRKFPKLGFIELTYVATAEPFRRVGFGQLLLQRMTKLWREESYSYVFTFADLAATRYFERAGFSQNIPVPRELYESWMDKYSYSVLSCCCLSEVVAPMVSTGISVKLLISLENASKFAREVWVDAIVCEESCDFVRVRYCLWLKGFVEVLRADSFRLRYSEE